MTTVSGTQGLRNLNYDHFAFYRRGLAFNAGLSRRNRKNFAARTGGAPVIYIPGGYDVRQIPFALTRQAKRDIDAVRPRELKGLRNSFVNAYNDLQRLKTYIATEKDGKLFRYKRCLGWGGNGLAAAFDVVDEGGNHVRSVVVKTLFDDEDESLEFEVNALMRHDRSEHIVQLVYIEGEGLVDNEKIEKIVKKRKTEDNKGGVKHSGSPDSPDSSDSSDSSSSSSPPMTIILELLENGDLSDFIIKVREHQETIPNRVLWGFTLCLVRMCIGLAFPPDTVNDYDGMPGPITETVPDHLKDQPARIVHFDMDPKNIFIGNISDDEHRITPVLKLGDFGMAEEVKDGKRDSYYEYMRRSGKRAFYAPEQFCIDWDYIPRDVNLIQSHPIAGNYHWHTNVWGLGMIMECLVTLCYPLIPPQPSQTSISPPQSKMNYWTYGAHVATAEYDHIDMDLRSIIVRCQANFPEDRPRLESLEEFVLEGMKKGYAGESDREILEWMNKILHGAPSSGTPSSLSSSLSSDGPGGTIGTGNPPIPPFFPQGVQLPPNAPPPQNPVAPPPRDPKPPTGIFDRRDSAVAIAAGFVNVNYGSGSGSASPLVAPNPSPAVGAPQVALQTQSAIGPRRTRRGGWARRIHPYGRPPGSY